MRIQLNCPEMQPYAAKLAAWRDATRAANDSQRVLSTRTYSEMSWIPTVIRGARPASPTVPKDPQVGETRGKSAVTFCGNRPSLGIRVETAGGAPRESSPKRDNARSRYRREATCAGRRRQRADHPSLLQILRDHGYNGVLSMECEGQAGPIVEKSLARLRGTLEGLGVPIETD